MFLSSANVVTPRAYPLGRKKLYDALTIFHDIHFQHGSFSPSSVVSRPSPSTPSDGTSEVARQLTIVGFSQAEWHLCPGENSCPELVQAKKALGLGLEEPST